MSAATVERSDWRDVITREELAPLLETDDWRSWLSIGLDWGIVAASLAMVYVWPNPLTAIVAVVLIGARQLGFAVMMHEAAHQTLFKNRALNDWVGNWLCAFPIWADLRPYRRYHLKHHAHNWTDKDPDLDLATKFPVTPSSMRRKIWRDLSGQVGWKRAKATLRRDVTGDGFFKTSREDAKNTAPAGWKNLRGVIITNLVLLALISWLAHPALYLLWVVAWFTTNSLVTRIRAIAEHNMPTDPSSDFGNTRTTLASWLERLLIAPNRVNYHLEHHLLMTVPFYNLPKLHDMLRERGALEGAMVVDGYLPVLRQAASKPA
jgi:fatty acid desaturase